RHAPVMLHFWHLLCEDREQDDLFVKGLVVPEVALEDQRRAVDVGREEDRRSAHTRRLRPLHLLEEAIHRDRGLRQESAEELGPSIPGTHEEEDADAER